MITDVEYQPSIPVGGMESSRDFLPCPPKRRRSMEGLDIDMIFPATDVLDERVERREMMGATESSFQNLPSPSLRSIHLKSKPPKTEETLQSALHANNYCTQQDIKLCRFDEIFSSKLNSRCHPRHGSEEEVSTGNSIQRSTNWKGSKLKRNSWSCPTNLGTKRSKKRSSMGSKQNHSFCTLLPTINEFQRTSFEDDYGIMFQDSVAATTSLRNKRTRRSGDKLNQQCKTSKRPSLVEDKSTCLDTDMSSSLFMFPIIDASIFLH
ncbi:hypothetical protein IV203_025279 [Nitzschia inconspicua]|uniref:Uncharacterized protein n=1 Tax=Nitzschia inconspicua TaxID=303405 RepID=A0A9K3K9P8_9STRA|nr:hypothetical protein IV203_024716 [Nitzschia inconspicua]KAG7362395.1 hypothetical protein IV203_025279 [Nitzschia inconspicua]